MDPSTTRILTPARWAALALIALVIGALAYLHLRPGTERPEVPEGATAGDLILRPCEYHTEDGALPADCGTLVVPESRADRASRLIALPVTRIRARSDRPAEPVFRLEGGPGQTNMRFAQASRLAHEHDVVLVGYRGVDGSSVLDCPEVTSALKRSADVLGAESQRAYATAFRSCADRLQRDGVDLAGYTLAERADDLEAARAALGYGAIDLLSESAGTRTAMIYSWRHPGSVHRSVMIGANPPGHFLWDPVATDEQIRRYAELCSRDRGCRRRTDDLAASMGRTATDIPERWWLLPIAAGNVRVASFYGLVDASSDAAPISAPMTLGSWLSAAEGDPSGLWFMSLAADLVFPEAFVWGDVGAASRADARAARRRVASGGPRASVLGDPGTAFLWGGGRLVDAWPAAPHEDRYSGVRTSRVETLVISGALDVATPPQVAAEELMPHLPNGHHVVLQGFGHTTDFWTQQQEAGTRLITAFLARGEVDDSLYVPQRIDFAPAVPHTTLAKIIAGAMAGLGLLTVLSLLWLPLRLRGRGGFGPTAGALLRGLYAPVLGLGGWVVGALIVITTTPGVALDDELLAVSSVGVPVALCVYLGWTRRDRSPRSRRAGLAAAAGGALAGAWLGFHATADLLAILTAVAGAVAGANLALLLLDAVRDRAAGARPSPPEATADRPPARRASPVRGAPRA